MGQKSNFITLRQENQSKLSFYNNNFIIYKYIFCYYLEVFFKRRGVFVLYNDFFFKNAVGFVNFNLFYTKRKLNFIKKKKLSRIKKIINIKVLLKLFSKIAVKFNITKLKFNFVILNNKVDKNILTFFYNKFKKYSIILFEKKFYLFIDFLKIISLVYCNILKIKNLLIVLTTIFSNLHKKKHTKFIDFIDFIFSCLCEKINSNIKGIKFILKGKLLGKSRASIYIIKKGRISIQTLKENISFNKQHIYTKYGVFGFKLWVNKKYDS